MWFVRALFIVLFFYGYLVSQALAKDPTFGEIKTNLTASPERFATVADFLDWLASEYPSYVQHYTLMHESRSLQGASYLNPRAIIFGSTGRLILAFNGQREQAGYESIELVEFLSASDNERPRFIFHEIEFPEGRAGAFEPKISEPNPSKCMACHTSELRPIWEPYRSWPGAYGSDDDAIASHSPEFEAYQRFVDRRDHHPRYRYLSTRSGSEVAPYASEMFSPHFDRRPNLHLTKFLIRMNAERLFGMLQAKNACLDRYQELLAMLLLDCSIPDDHWDEIEGTLRELIGMFGGRTPKLSAARWTNSASQNSGAGVMALLNLFEIDHRDWSLSFDKNFWTTSNEDGESRTGDFVLLPLMRRIAFDLPEIQATITPSDYYTGKYSYSNFQVLKGILQAGQAIDRRNAHQSCDMLADRFTLKQREYHGVSPHQTCGISGRHEMPKAIRMCQSCHESGSAPPIDFAEIRASRNKERIEQVLRRLDPQNPAGRMPPSRAITRREYEEIRRFLSGI